MTYYVVFARYDSCQFQDGVHYPDSGRFSYLTDDEQDAHRTWDELNSRPMTDDEFWTVRRGCIAGPYESLHDADLQHYFQASDDVAGRDDDLTECAWYIGWYHGQPGPTPALMELPTVAPALQRP